MKPSQFFTGLRAGVFACSLLLFPLASTPFAQTATPTPDPPRVETRDDRDNTGLWGLVGLAGLLGLMGRRRHPEDVRTFTDTRERSRL
jgi:MYXO-CTERM domain-containing protein